MSLLVMLKEPISPNVNISKGACCGMGLFVVLFFVVIGLVVATVAPEGFSSQPMIFTKNIKTVPGNCLPYSGCFYPSFMSNPISLKDNMRQPTDNEIWCSVSWRDCNAYQTCSDGKCVPKI